MRILVVEDDGIIGDGLVAGLQLDEYAVDWLETKSAAEAALSTTPYDLLILDLGLPDGSGLDILRGLRAKKNPIPVLILTAYDELSDKIKGLDTGADDYLVKPFDLDELRARVRALQRRAMGRSTPVIEVANISMDPSRLKVSKDGENIKLGPREFAILRVLMENQGRILSKSQIEDKLYGWNMEIESNTIEVHMHGLRKKLGKSLITTIRNVGYVIE
ncbi:response regulator [Planctobacterium marinum]|uniref:response regulator n=1 Tax=Planctobacterium marinum TaxID=1631968 RepID=UPI001E49648B|nr:response regulator [Planctobacterium marinum]MCC2607519.1 response regulator [Planctobacterium marinum]